MRTSATGGAPPPGSLDREIWRRSQEIEASADEAERLLDLAAFADHRLDEDEAARIAALLAHDLDAADDVATARVLANAATVAASPGIIERAALLVGEELREAEIIAFSARPPIARPWYSAATWSSLAAAMVLAGWLGFNLGSGLPGVAPSARATDEGAASELFDPTPPLILRDFTENSQI